MCGSMGKHTHFCISLVVCFVWISSQRVPELFYYAHLESCFKRDILFYFSLFGTFPSSCFRNSVSPDVPLVSTSKQSGSCTIDRHHRGHTAACSIQAIALKNVPPPLAQLHSKGFGRLLGVVPTREMWPRLGSALLSQFVDVACLIFLKTNIKNRVQQASHR